MFKTKDIRLILLPIGGLLIVMLMLAQRRDTDSDIDFRMQKLSDEGRYGVMFQTMGTDAFVIVYADSRTEAKNYINAAHTAIDHIGTSMSLYDDRSELSRLNRMDAGEKMQVSDELYYVIERAIHYAEISNGAFDPSFTPLKDLWREAQSQNKQPEETAVEITLEKVGYENIELLDDNHIVFRTADMKLDLGGIAKGYAVDMAVAALREKGCKNALVDIGGDIAVLGSRKDGTPWRIGVQNPFGEGHKETILHIQDTAVATSGDYARYYTIDGERFSHIIDPRTGIPVRNVPSVTLIAEAALEADALATAVNVLGAEGGIELVDSLEKVECMITIRKDEDEDGEERTGTYYSENFQDSIAE